MGDFPTEDEGMIRVIGMRGNGAYGCDTDYEYEIDAEINAKWLRSLGDFKTFESYIAELISEYLTAVA